MKACPGSQQMPFSEVKFSPYAELGNLTGGRSMAWTWQCQTLKYTTCFVGNTQDLGARNTCPPSQFPLWCQRQEQLPDHEEKPCEQGLFTFLFALKNIYLLMFKNTQVKVTVTVTSCPSLSTVFFTTGAVVKVTIARWAAQGSILKNSFVKETDKQTTPWQWQTLCLLFLHSFQLRSNLYLTLSCG